MQHALASVFDHARKTPDRLALVCDGRSLTYAEFARRIAATRALLTRQDFDPDRIVVTVIQGMLERWCVRLALRSLGLTSAAVLPEKQLELLRPDEVAAVIVSGSESGPRPAAEPGAPWKVIRTPPGLVDREVGEAKAQSPAGPTGGHLIVTSGTTGEPKRILIDAANERRNVEQRLDLFGIGRDSIVNVASWSGWTSVGYIVPLGVWSRGAAVVLQTGDNPVPPFERRDLTHAILTPAMLEETLALAGDRLARNDGLRVWVGGAALSPQLAAAAKARLTPKLAVQVASSEAGLWCTTDIETLEDLGRHRISPGRAVEVVDSEGAALPPGQTGALRIDQLAGIDGYWRDEAASRAYFRDGWFYPGDTGVIDPDGRLRLLGRTTEVINVGGSKVALPLLDDQITRELEVPAAVFCVETGDRMDLHVAIRVDGTLRRGSLAAAGRALMPPFSNVHFHVVDALPLTPTGKLMRDQLKSRILASWRPQSSDNGV